ncbi:Alpha-amylase [Dyadobacter sp. CECT 9275]|uniref:Alpha-amylase n=1 Tax=Dyadobacter helix TaxID=2822344 RepID=A0A916JHL5_9BACT|nr:alpha-amylase family glycosyl hydrolase [Dyadobacter sp. CECT 9275]CAG5017863.1 Alpha-amylase [Dyadobacter sp. CECT 9275]
MSGNNTVNSIFDIDLSPKPGKTYWADGNREWREKFIYFLLIDRFHDDLERAPEEKPNRQTGFGNADQLQRICGGTLSGITRHLDYIRDLGCTALWLSPVFQNNAFSYHGYAVENYLEVNRRFGTKKDLEELVEKAHDYDIKVFLDIVLHHSGDNWTYPGDEKYYYYQGAVFPFESWRSQNLPVPIELRNPELYWRKGQIRNFDAYPETREGDFANLKSYKNDASPEALLVQQILTKIHCYWIRETDIDGFRIDAVKHMGEETVSQFCSHVREYAYKLGKRNFFFFGEFVGPEEMYNRYIGPKTSVMVEDKAIYFGLNSVLDFPLYHILADVIRGVSKPQKLVERYESLRQGAMGRGEFGEFLVTFIDNHDQLGQVIKRRFGKETSENQVIAGIGFLLCALGTPCIYYGTEQGFDGSGEKDFNVREAMFSLEDPKVNALNKSCRIYQQIAALARLRKENAALRFGRMYMRKLSVDGKNFMLPTFEKCLLAFSRVLYDEEIVVAYNSSQDEYDEEYIRVDPLLNPQGSSLNFIYGQHGSVNVLLNEEGNKHFIKLKLEPGQFVVLTNKASSL